jgi:spectrin alpha
MTQTPADAPVIQPRIDTLKHLWGQLNKDSADKGQKLKEANEQQQYNHGVEDIEFWLTDVELLLASKDLGKDLPSVQNLIKKHELIVADIEAHQGRVDQVSAEAIERGGGPKKEKKQTPHQFFRLLLFRLRPG